MKIKTSELTGQALDWAVAKCEGYTHLRRNPHRFSSEQELIMAPPRASYGPVLLADLAFSTNWAQGGPIIERERVSIGPYGDEFWAQSSAIIDTYYGTTPLIAAMRAFVASRLGDTPEVPDELA
jgi:hypothetical protein